MDAQEQTAMLREWYYDIVRTFKNVSTPDDGSVVFQKHEHSQMKIQVIINGAITTTPTLKSDKLSSLLKRALKLSGNSGREYQDWQVRDANGVLLETNRKLSDFKFTAGTRLFASLAVGAGGAA